MLRSAIASISHDNVLMDQPASPDGRQAWLRAFLAARAETERRAAPLTAEDQGVQSMADASPTKWHRAHTTWFFEQFLLEPYLAELSPFRRAVRLSIQFIL